jgi:hypothetical protein
MWNRINSDWEYDSRTTCSKVWGFLPESTAAHHDVAAFSSTTAGFWIPPPPEIPYKYLNVTSPKTKTDVTVN